MNENTKKSSVNKKVLTGIKYGAALAITFAAFAGSKSGYYLAGSLLELAAIFFLSDMMIRKMPKTGYVINSLLYLLYVVQQVILYYGSTYLTLIMLTNVDSIQDLEGRSTEYILAGILILVCSFLPICEVTIKHLRPHNGLIAVLIADLIFSMTLGNAYSPLYGYVNVAVQAKEQKEREAYIASQPDMTGKFYQKGVNGNFPRPATLPEQPNVILIMTEGLSQSIVEDERNIMPNVRSYEEKSTNFINYYNHTAATYRGIIGQLYSGYQNNNLDKNNLVSIQEIMKDQGYYTSFLNTEENNIQFTDYLRSMGFDDVLGKDPDDWLTDKEAYEFLWDTVSEQAEQDQPFFTCIYTFNTHLTFDSTEEKFGDGSDAELNKFYNCDYQFGQFMEKFNNSDLTEDTIVVFTSDHCTYVDDAFKASFPDTVRTHSFCDRVPFFIYSANEQPYVVDAEGRNSLCLAPTILDFLDISEENYFLGSTLFLGINNDTSPYDTIFTTDNAERSTTKGEEIQSLDEVSDAEMEQSINDYFAAAQQERE